MHNRTAKGQLRILSVLALVSLVAKGTFCAQTNTAHANQHVAAVACSVQTDRSEWEPSKPAMVSVTVESLSDKPFEIPLWSDLSLAPVSPRDPFLTRIPGNLVAGIDPSMIDPLLPPASPLIRDSKGDGSVRLRFIRKGQKATFKLDARDLVWDYEVVNREPAFKLFSLAKPGSYQLQFRMWWENGSCDSAPTPLKVANETQK